MPRTSRVVTVVFLVAVAVAVATLPASAQTCGAPPAGVVHHWSGDDNANDSVGGNNGTPSGGVTFGPGVCGHAFIFDGTGSVNVPFVPSLALGPAFTVSAWVRIDQIAGEFVPFISHDDGSGSQRKWMLWYTPSANRLGFELNALPGDPPFIGSPISVQWQPLTGRWYHLAVTYDGSVWGLYVNGAQVAASIAATPIPEGQSPLQIGAAEAARLTGGVDDVSIFNRSLQSADVLALYNAGASGNVTLSSMVPTATGLSSPRFCEVPCTTTIRAFVTTPDFASVVNEGAVHLQSLDPSGSQLLRDWTMPVTNGVATFQDITPASTDAPQTVVLTAGYIPTSSAFLASSGQSALSITPPLEAQIAVPASGPLAIDEQTNRVYAAFAPIGGYVVAPAFAPANQIHVFDGTTNHVLDPIVFPFGDQDFVSIAIDTPRRRLYVYAFDFSTMSADVWVWDLDHAAIVEDIPLPASDVGDVGWQTYAKVNPTTGILYLSGPESLIAVNPLAIGNEVSGTPYDPSTFVNGLQPATVPGVNAKTNLIYDHGNIFDGGQGNARLPFMFDFKGALVDGFLTSSVVGVNRKTNAIYVPILDPAAGPCVPCRQEGVVEAIEILDGNKNGPTFNALQARSPLTPLYLGQPFGWFPAAVEVNSSTNRVYVSFAIGGDSGGNPQGPGGDPFRPDFSPSGDVAPVATLDGTTGVKVSEWWYLQPCVAPRWRDWNNSQAGLTLTVNPVNGRIYINSCDGTILVYRDAVTNQQSTSTGSNVAVSVPQVTVTFPSVSAPGNTTVQSLSASELNVSLPGQFSLTGAIAYDISTTATVTAPIQLCFNASSITDETTFDGLAVLHAENGVWVDRTVSRDFTTGTICASSPSLSPFTVARRKPYTVKALYDTTRAFKTGSTAPIKIQILDPTGANVSVSSLPITALHLIQRSTSAAALLNDSGNANPDSGFRFDASMVGYIFNLSLKGVPSGTYDLQLRVGADGRTYTTSVQVR